jgi:hypothetical protein
MKTRLMRQSFCVKAGGLVYLHFENQSSAMVDAYKYFVESSAKCATIESQKRF